MSKNRMSCHYYLLDSFERIFLLRVIWHLQKIYRNNSYKAKLNYPGTLNLKYFEKFNQFLIYLSRKVFKRSFMIKLLFKKYFIIFKGCEGGVK